MKCPNCDIALLMTERKGIEIDFCSQCRGIWLDRGELDKIIEISAQELATPAPEPTPPQTEYQPAKSDPRRQYRPSPEYDERDYSREMERDRDRDWDRDYDSKYKKKYYKQKYKKKNKTLLHTLFDIID